MTTSSASCSSSHAASDRSGSGLLPNIRRSNWYSLSISTSDTTTASILIMDIHSRYPIGHSSSWLGAESVLRVTLTRVAGYRRSPRGRQRRPIIHSITHAPDQTPGRPRLIHWAFDLAAPGRYNLTSE